MASKAKPEKKEQQSEARRNLEDLKEKAATLGQAQQRIVEQLESLDNEIATASTLEQEQREESLSKGYPAKANKKLRDLREERENLVEQSTLVQRLQARLQLEGLDMECQCLQEQRSAALHRASEIEEQRLKPAQAALDEARLEATATRDTEHSLREQIAYTRRRLFEIDPQFAQEEQQAYEERLAAIVEGQRRAAEKEAEEEAERMASLPQEERQPGFIKVM